MSKKKKNSAPEAADALTLEKKQEENKVQDEKDSQNEKKEEADGAADTQDKAADTESTQLDSESTQLDSEDPADDAQDSETAAQGDENGARDGDDDEDAGEAADDNKTVKKAEDKNKKSEKKLEKKQEREERRSLKSRAFKRGWFSIALVALFLAGVIVVNLMANTLVERIPALVVDTTGSGKFDLTDESYDYLKKLTQDITLIVLADEKTYREGGEYYIQSDALLHKYENYSDHISLEFIDLSENPTYTGKYPDESLAQYGIIVQGENDYRYLSTMDYFDVQIDYSSYSYYIAGCKLEEAVTSAILNVTLDNRPKVSFIKDISEESYSAFKDFLDNNGFETVEISPAIDEIPEDTSILVLYAPSIDLGSTYVDKISAFLNNSGNYGKQLLYLPSSSLAAKPNIESLLEEWGMELVNGVAVENDMTKISQVTYGVYLFSTEYTDAAYTELMKNKNLPFCVFYGEGLYTHPIMINDNEKASSLMKLSEQSEIIYPAESGDEPTVVGTSNLNVGVIASKGTTKADTDEDSSNTVTTDSHIIVFGSNYVVTESFLTSQIYGNASYVLSMLNTLVDRDNTGLQIETQSLKAEPLSITSAQLRVLTLVFVVFIPVIVLVLGIVIFVKRRNM